MIILKSQVVLMAVAKPLWKEHEETETNKMLPLFLLDQWLSSFRFLCQYNLTEISCF